MSAITVVLETPRLLLRRWLPEDLEPFARMNADPVVMEYFAAPYTHERTVSFYQTIQTELDTCGYGLYAAQEKESGLFMGYIGFHRWDDPQMAFCPCMEIGWRLDKPFWGKGYATEGAKACLELGFTQLGLPDVYSYTAIGNRRSQRVMEKIGLMRGEEFLNPSVPEESIVRHLVYYHLSREEYLSRSPQK